jgi:hypothetical protein
MKEFLINNNKTALAMVLIILALIFAQWTYGPSYGIMDEAWYVNQAGIIEKYGFSSLSISNIYGPPGPLHAFTMRIIEIAKGSNLESLKLPRSIAALLIIACCALTAYSSTRLTGILRKDNWSLYFLTPLLIPFCWIDFGFTHTEAFSHFWVCSALFFWVIANTIKNSFGFVWVILGSLCCAIATLGRLPLLPLCFLPLVISCHSGKKDYIFRVIGVCIAISMVTYQIYLWKALRPPWAEGYYQSYGEKNLGFINFAHLCFSYAYSGIILFSIAPKLIVDITMRSMKFWLPLALLIFFLSLIHINNTKFIAGSTFALKFLKEDQLIYWRMFIALFGSGLGAIFVIALFQIVREQKSIFTTMLGIIILGLVTTPVKIVDMYTSRYTNVAAFCLCILCQPVIKNQPWLKTRLILSMILGLSIVTKKYTGEVHAVTNIFPGMELYRPCVLKPTIK